MDHSFGSLLRLSQRQRSTKMCQPCAVAGLMATRQAQALRRLQAGKAIYGLPVGIASALLVPAMLAMAGGKVPRRTARPDCIVDRNLTQA